MARVSLAITAANSSTLSAQALLNQRRLMPTRPYARQEAGANETLSSPDTATPAAPPVAPAAPAAPAVQAQAIAAYQATYRAPSQTGNSQVPAKTQDFLLRLYQSSSGKFAAAGNALNTNNAPPVINAQGEAIGRILNLST